MLKSIKENANYTSVIFEQGVGEENWANATVSVLNNPPMRDFGSDNTNVLLSVKDYLIETGDEVLIGDGSSVSVETLGTVSSVLVPADISSSSYDNVSFSVTNQDSSPFSLSFSTDGTKMFVVGNTIGTVYQYTLSTAFDLSTASYDSVSFSVSGQDTNPYSLAFSPDGTKMFVLGSTNDTVYQYTLSTAFNVGTASYDSVSFNVSGQDASPFDLAFSPDGTKMFVLGTSSDTVHQYTLSTAFDVGTASYSNVSFNATGQDIQPLGLAFSTDGTKMFVLGNDSDSIYQYSTQISEYTKYTSDISSFSLANPVSTIIKTQDMLSTSLSYAEAPNRVLPNAYDLSSKIDSISTTSLVYTDTPSPEFLPVVGDSIKVFTASNPPSGDGLDVILNDVSSVVEDAPYEISGASYDLVSFSVAGQDTAPVGLSFSQDGTKMFTVGDSSKSVHQYTLSTAFDISTATYDSVSFSFTGQDDSPYGLAFSPDGTKMFMIGAGSGSVYQYTLSTAFDVGTASYDSVSFSVGGQEIGPSGLEFSPDGTKMFILGQVSDSVHQYTLSTAFDLNTASYDSVSFSVFGQDALPVGLSFSQDGTKMFILGYSSGSVYQYTLSTAFDLNTASYDSVNSSVAGQDASPYDIAFSQDGTKMFMVGFGSDSVHQYSLQELTITLSYTDTGELPLTQYSSFETSLDKPSLVYIPDNAENLTINSLSYDTTNIKIDYNSISNLSPGFRALAYKHNSPSVDDYVINTNIQLNKLV